MSIKDLTNNFIDDRTRQVFEMSTGRLSSPKYKSAVQPRDPPESPSKLAATSTLATQTALMLSKQPSKDIEYELRGTGTVKFQKSLNDRKPKQD